MSKTSPLWRKPIFWILLGALMIRVLAGIYIGNEVSGLSSAYDEISYSLLGERLVQGYGLTFPDRWYPWYEAGAPQSYYSVAMSLYLAAIYKIFGYSPLAARLITAILGTLVVWMIYLLSRRYFGERVGLVAALWAAFYSYLVFFSVTLVTEMPFILALLAALNLAASLCEKPSGWKWIGLGGALAVAVLFRMAVVFFIPFLLGWIAYRQPRQDRKRLWIPVVIVVLAIMPFTVRNYLLWGRFLLLEAQFGHVFWNGNHPGHLDTYDGDEVFEIPEEVLASHNDVEITNRLLRMGIQNVMNDPRYFVQLTLLRLREFFKFWPTTDTTLERNLLRVLGFGLMWPFAIAGLWLSRRQWRELFPIYMFMIIHTGVYAISWTMIRYRAPLDAVLIPFAALAVVTMLRFLYNIFWGRGDRASITRAAKIY